MTVTMKQKVEAHNQETRCLTIIFALSVVLFYACIQASATDATESTMTDAKKNEVFGIILSVVSGGLIIVFKLLKACQTRNGGKMMFKVLHLGILLSGAWSFGAI